MILLDAGKFSAALAALNHVGPGPGAALCQHLRGDALHNLGWLEDARAAYTQAVQLSADDPVVSSKLGYTEVRMGIVEPGIARLQRAAHAAPQLADVQERLMKGYVALGHWTRAAEQAEKWAVVEATPKAFLRAVSIRVYLRQHDEAREILSRGIVLFPDSLDLQRAVSELDGRRPPESI
jgi:tetratricopeptide (TPR) repeat protein